MNFQNKSEMTLDSPGSIALDSEDVQHCPKAAYQRGGSVTGIMYSNYVH